MKSLLYLFLVSSIFLGCSTNKPPQSAINEYLNKKFPSDQRIINQAFGHTWYEKVKNLKIINQWSDENQNGIYYLKIGYILGQKKDYNDWILEKRESTIIFKKEGDLWTPNIQGTSIIK